MGPQVLEVHGQTFLLTECIMRKKMDIPGSRSDCPSMLIRNFGLQFFFSLSSFGMRVCWLHKMSLAFRFHGVVFSTSALHKMSLEFRCVSSSIFWTSLRRIGNNYLNVWENSLVKLPELFFVERFLITSQSFYCFLILSIILFPLDSVLVYYIFLGTMHFSYVVQFAGI